MKILIAVLMIASVCRAQNTTGSGPTSTAPITVGPAQPILHCDKYQHFEPEHLGCKFGTYSDACSQLVPARCVDDLHWVTEREWQAIMDRIEKLEAKAKGTQE